MSREDLYLVMQGLNCILSLNYDVPFSTYLRSIWMEDGYQPHLIAPEQGYRKFIEGSINYFRRPVEAFVDVVHFFLKELVRKSMGECQELKRFPSLQTVIVAASNEALEKFRDQSKKTVIILVDMEYSYLIVDFLRKLPQEVERGGAAEKGGAEEKGGAAVRCWSPAPSPPTVDRLADDHFRRIGSNDDLLECSYVIYVILYHLENCSTFLLLNQL